MKKVRLLVQYLSKKFFLRDSTKFQHWKMTLKIRIFRCLRRLFIILVSLTMTLFSEKMLISSRCIHGFMSNLIKKSWTDSTTYVCTKGTVSLLKLIGWSKFGPGEIWSQETATLREQLNIVASFWNSKVTISHRYSRF